MNRMKFLLDEEEMPDRWYNILSDLSTPLDPPLNPKTEEPLKPEDLAPLFPMELIKQEASADRWIPIPEEVQDIYRLWRPTPLYRARRLEKALGTPAKMYYNWEGVSPPGSHKPNTAVAQAYYNREEGVEKIATETGAGQWGSALAFGTMLFGLECEVYMVRVSYDQKPYRRILMETWGANCYPSPSERTEAGRQALKEDPESPGSLGLAISEAIEVAIGEESTKYAIGSCLNHVLLHQTIQGLECKKQFEMAGDYPDHIFGCTGGGSNFGGLFLPFAGDKLRGKSDVDTAGKDVRELQITHCEPASCPTLTKGPYMYDHGDAAGYTPYLMMYSLGHRFIPPPIHAGGLRYHGDAPILCKLQKEGVTDAIAFHQNETFEAAHTFARAEGFVIAPETAHCAKAWIDEALRCKETGEEKTLLMANSGHGHFDLAAYDAYHRGKLIDYEYPKELAEKAIAEAPKIGR